MATEWTSFFSDLFRDYLAADTALAALTSKKTKDATAKLTRPRLIVSCESESTTHRASFKGTVNVMYGIAITKDGEEPADAAVINAAIETRLQDDAAWTAYVQTLTVPTRTGWMITKQRLGTMQEETDADKHTRDYTFPLTIHAVTKR